MQFVCRPKHELRSVIHVDGTSRVQTVPKNSRSALRAILEEYFERTGVPMLLNTSLNIKGQPMVNDAQDAKEFEARYRIRVF
jgi:carbamoyltransferase